MPEYPKFFPQLRKAIEDPSARPPIHALNFALRYSHSTTGSGKFNHLDLPASGFVGGLHLNPAAENMTESEMLALPPAEQVWQLAYNYLPSMGGHGEGERQVRAGMEAWIRWLGIGKVIAVSLAQSVHWGWEEAVQADA